MDQDRAASKVTALRNRLADVPQRLAVVSKVAKSSGLMWALTVPGVRAAVKALREGAQNPSQVYRIHALNSPDKPAILWRDQTITFGDFDQRLDAIASALTKRGFRKGDSVVLMMRNRPEFVQMAAAVSRMGGAAVSVSWRSTPSELVYLATHCGAKCIAFEHDLWHVVEQAKKDLSNIKGESFFAVGGPVAGTTPFERLLDQRASFEPEAGAAEDAAVVIYTSGTTGKPKGAVRKFQKDALPAAMRFMAETPMRVDDIHLTPCPLYHSTAFGFLTLSHILGATVVLMDEFKPEPFLQHVER